MEKRILSLILVFVALYGGIWLFNHVNAWVGIIAIIFVIYVIIKLIVLTIKKQEKDEK